VRPVGRLLSVNVGLPKDVSWRGKTVFTGVYNDPDYQSSDPQLRPLERNSTAREQTPSDESPFLCPARELVA